MRRRPSLSFDEYVPEAPAIRPLYNIDVMFDVQCGHYTLGKHNEAILNGGLARITGVGGLPNTYKSTLMDFMMLSVQEHYAGTPNNTLDSEESKTQNRINSLCFSFDHLKNGQIFEDGLYRLTGGSDTTLDKWFTKIKDYAKDKLKSKSKDAFGTLPMISNDDSEIKTYRFSLAGVDSLSRASTTLVDGMLDKADVGSSETNTVDMQSGRVKHQFLQQLPILAEKASMGFVMTAHVDETFSMDPRNPPKTKLGFLGNKMKFKGVPPQFYYLTNNLWYCYSAKPLLDNNKMPQYSLSKDDVSTDLMEILCQNLRGKYGVSGVPLSVLASQSKGVLAALSHLHNLRMTKGSAKQWENGFGISGNDRSYWLDIYPEVKLSRNTARNKIDNDPKLRRALEITLEIALAHQYFVIAGDHVVLSMSELYENIKKKGYDWDRILSGTRYFWVFEEDEEDEDKRQLTGMDIIRMNAGTYHPYWMTDMPVPAGTTVTKSLPILGTMFGSDVAFNDALEAPIEEAA